MLSPRRYCILGLEGGWENLRELSHKTHFLVFAADLNRITLFRAFSLASENIAIKMKVLPHGIDINLCFCFSNKKMKIEITFVLVTAS